MLGTLHYKIFLLGVVALVLSPGQDTFYVLGRSIAQGRRAGFCAMLGIQAGCFTQTCAVAFGLSAVLASAPHALQAVKLLGAFYLVYVGSRMALSRSADFALKDSDRMVDGWGSFKGAYFCNLLNPKAVLFYLAFLPQFVAPSASNKIMTLLFLGCTLILLNSIWFALLALFGSAMTRRMRENSAWYTLLQRGAGILFVGLGISLLAQS